jgi:photosystem II stability/assembly factor-like uncharacterized protein
MKRFTWISLAFLVLLFVYFANAQVTNLKLNGVSSNFTMVQGDSLKWEYNLPIGGSATFEIWVDLNGNGVIDPSTDKQVFGTMTQTDGQASQESGIGDMDGLVNGHIFTAVGNIGFAPTKYIFRFSNGGTAQTIAGVVTALPSPTYTVKGVVTVPGKSAQNIYISAGGDNGVQGEWDALTDAGGNYTINFNASAGGLRWYVQPQDQIPPYVQPASIPITLTGSLTGINFTYQQSAAKIVGYLKGEDGHVFANVGINSGPQNSGNGKNTTTDANGFFQFDYSLNDITSFPIWRVQAGNGGVAPMYLPPYVDAISLHQYDSLRVDLMAYIVNDSITGRITLDGHAPGGKSFQLYAFEQDSGQTSANTDPNTGNFTLYVSKKVRNYYLGVNNLPQNYGYTWNNSPFHPSDKNVILNVATIMWLPQTSTTSNSLKSISFVNSTTGWVAGVNGIVLKTTNAGTTWSNQTTNSSSNINGIFFLNTSTGWLVGDGGIIKTTTDGGNTWTSQNSTTSMNLQAVQFIDANIGWVVGGMEGSKQSVQSIILKTTNGGTTWTAQNFTFGQLFSLAMINSSIGIAVGSGLILITPDGGANWNLQFQSNTNLYSVRFADATTGWAVGDYNIFKTTNGGSNWTPQNAIVSNLRSVYCINKSTAWVVGGNGDIYRTTDGGSTWTGQPTSKANSLNAVWFVDANNGWAVGDFGLIFHTSSGGATSVFKNQSDEIPRGYSLSQNYPNPFNPSTIISFSLPCKSFVSLKIFDVLGREVSTIVSEEMSAGSYSRQWNAANMTSGVYFYRLQAGAFTVTKKLVLLR